MAYRKCSGMGGVSVTGHVSTYIVCMEYRKCSGMGGVSTVNRKRQHVACLEHRIYNGNLIFKIQEIVPCTIPPCSRKCA